MQASARPSPASSSSPSSTTAALPRSARARTWSACSPTRASSAYGQLDVFALESRQLNAEAALTIVRQDDVRECVFAVTRNKDITNFGELAANAGRLRFILPPAGSGSAGTFEFLRSIDADGLGKAKSVINAASADEAIREALAADDTVSLLVEFADPDSRALRAGAQARRARRAGDRPHHPAPGDRRQEDLLRPGDAGRERAVGQVGPQDRDRMHAARASSPALPTACKASRPRKDHADLIRTVADLKSGSLLPEETLFQRLLKRTKELSASGTEKMLEATEQAREKAKPYTDKALDAAKEAERPGQAGRRPRRRSGQALLRQEQGRGAEGLRRRPEARQGADGKVQAGHAEEELSAVVSTRRFFGYLRQVVSRRLPLRRRQRLRRERGGRLERHGLSSPTPSVDCTPTGELSPMAFLVGVRLATDTPTLTRQE